MRIESLMFDCSHVRQWQARASIASLVLCSLVVLPGCTVNPPSCDGRFEPINRPAPVSDPLESEEVAAERETTP